jgi:hypothetical protein
MTLNIEVRPRGDVTQEHWDAFVEASDEAWFWHRWDFIDAFSERPGTQDVSFALADGRGELLAILPAHRIVRVVANVPFVRLMSYGWAACAAKLPASEREKVLSALHDHLLQLIAAKNTIVAEAQIASLTPSLNGTAAPRVNPLILAGFENSQTETWIVDLACAPEDIRRRYSDTTRYEIRRASRSEFRLREAAGPKDIDIYYRVHLETCARTGAQPNPHRYFQAIFEKCQPRGLARILFLERQGEVVAAQNTALYKGGALYWTGASISDKGGGDNRLLMDAQIMAARQDGCTRYETGQAFVNPATAKEGGLSHFKRSFGAELYPFYRGMRYSPRLSLRFLWRFREMLQKVRKPGL